MNDEKLVKDLSLELTTIIGRWISSHPSNNNVLEALQALTMTISCILDMGIEDYDDKLNIINVINNSILSIIRDSNGHKLNE